MLVTHNLTHKHTWVDPVKQLNYSQALEKKIVWV